MFVHETQASHVLLLEGDSHIGKHISGLFER